MFATMFCLFSSLSVKEANKLVFVTPHQFMEGMLRIRPEAEAISLIKGMDVKTEGPCMISKLITDMLGVNCCVLMGADIANEAQTLLLLSTVCLPLP